MELVGNRRAELHQDGQRAARPAHLEFTIPARGLIGLRTRLLNATSGTAIMHHNFYDYQPLRGAIPGPRERRHGLHRDRARSRPTPSKTLHDRGMLFVAPGDQVYEGQIVGEHCRDNDLAVNVCREKKLTNMRAPGADKTIMLKPPRDLTLELALEYIEDDELVEVTPDAIRLRKRMLTENDRKRDRTGQSR